MAKMSRSQRARTGGKTRPSVRKGMAKSSKVGSKKYSR